MTLALGPNPFFREKLPSGIFSYTVPAAMSHMLNEAEARFGERDKSWTILGAYFIDRLVPNVFFPDSPDKKHIVIQLPLRCVNNSTQAMIDTAQEIVHLLSPKLPPANNLEEGLATEFTVSWLKAHLGVNWWNPGDPNYDKTWKEVQALLSQYPNAIKDIRKEENVISNITFALIKKHCPNVSDASATYLSSTF